MFLRPWKGNRLGKKCTVETQSRDCPAELVCINGECASCFDDSQCSGYPTNACIFSATKNSYVCRHKPLFPNVSNSDVLTTVFAALFCMLAAAAGVGGGALLVPLFTLVAEFPPSQAIAVSAAAILGGAIANYILYKRRVHPRDNTQSLIDYDVALTMEPPALAGSVIGVQLARLLPEWSLAFTLLLVLISAAIRTGRRAFSLFKAESDERGADNGFGSSTLVGDGLTDTVDAESIMGGETMNGNASLRHFEREALLAPYLKIGTDSANTLVDTADDEGLGGGDDGEAYLNSSQSSINTHKSAGDSVFSSSSSSSSADPDEQGWQRTLSAVMGVMNGALSSLSRKQVCVLALLCCNGFIALYALMVGGEGRAGLLNEQCEGALYWAAVLSPLPVLGLITLWATRWVHQYHAEQARKGAMAFPGEAQWTHRHTGGYVYPAMCSLAGVASGMLGLGGGTIKAPLLFEMGMLPEPTAATVAFMILFTSLSTLSQYLVHGMVALDYAGWFALVGFCATIVGHLVTAAVIARLRRPSIVVFVVTAMLVLGAIMMTVRFLAQAKQDAQEGLHMGLKGFCH